mgnify:CR=1 FL=1
MKKLFKPLLLAAIVTSYQSVSGQMLNSSYLTARYSLDRISAGGVSNNSVLPGLPMPPPELIGDPFLSLHYNTGNYLLYDNNVLNNVPSKLDLLRNEFYFITSRGVRVFDGGNVKSFSIKDSLTSQAISYINARELKYEDNTFGSGFYAIIYDAPFALLKKTEAQIIKSNYNAALNVGARDDRIKKFTNYYYLVDGIVRKLPKKSITQIFGAAKADVDSHIKLNDLNLKEESHLKLAFEYYNSTANLVK